MSSTSIPDEDERVDLPRVSTGSEGLDDILGGGFDANRLYLYEGRPGTGKTTIALQFLLEGVRNVGPDPVAGRAIRWTYDEHRREDPKARVEHRVLAVEIPAHDIGEGAVLRRLRVVALDELGAQGSRPGPVGVRAAGRPEHAVGELHLDGVLRGGRDDNRPRRAGCGNFVGQRA